MSVYVKGNDAILEWSTTSRSNNYGFEIFRSQNSSLKFRRIGFINIYHTTSISHDYQFVDKDLPTGKYNYRLKQIDHNGNYQYSEILKISICTPMEFHLFQNYPNPFNSLTNISYSLSKSSHVDLIIYDINGKEVCRLVDEFQEPGHYNVMWNGFNSQDTLVASGIYYYKIKVSDLTKYRKIVYLK